HDCDRALHAAHQHHQRIAAADLTNMKRVEQNRRDTHAFTIIELLIVMAIIIVLAGLVIATSGYVQEKSKRSRTEAEIAAMSAALESYKADNGIYPTDLQKTEAVDPLTVPVQPASSGYLYGELTGDKNFDGTPEPTNKTYLSFMPASLLRGNMSEPISASNPVSAIRDSYGDPYGYSTMKAADPNAPGGYNPTYDLWSAAGTEGATATDQLKWIKNW
ncbi:MAG: prepilin-type N-terminal cleavage/methylation domain-containing protein, partial [Chthoniobacterales bacterium]